MNTSNNDWFSSSHSKIYLEDLTLQSTRIDGNFGVFVYTRNGMNYELKVPLQNGKREGKAQLVNQDGMVVSNLTFTDDELTGFCIIRDKNGIERFRGMLVNGKKEGKCIEYDENGNEVFNGYYSHDQPHKLFEPCKGHPGFVCEYSEYDGSLLTIAQYSAAQRKSGLCYTIRNKVVVKVSHFVNDIEDYITAIFEENTMTEYSRSGKVIYTGGFLVQKRHGFGKEYLENGRLVYEGLWQNGKRCTEWKKDKNKKGFINEITSGVVVSSAQYVKQKGYPFKHGTCFDFNSFKRCVRECVYQNGKLQHIIRKFNEDGVMIEYRPDGQKIYEGQWSGDYIKGFYRNGKGKEFSNGKIIYDGDFKKGYRDGNGTFFVNGYRRYVGTWKQGYPHGFGTLFDFVEGEDDNNVTLLSRTKPTISRWNHGYRFDVNRNCFVDYVKGELAGLKEIEWARWMSRDVMRKLKIVLTIILLILACMFIGWVFMRPIKAMYSTIRLNLLTLFKKGKLNIRNCTEYQQLTKLSAKSIKEIHFADNCCSEADNTITFVLQSRNRYERDC